MIFLDDLEVVYIFIGLKRYSIQPLKQMIMKFYLQEWHYKSVDWINFEFNSVPFHMKQHSFPTRMLPRPNLEPCFTKKSNLVHRCKIEQKTKTFNETLLL